MSINRLQYVYYVLARMERRAREMSAFSSTSIEGNPLPLTDVKKILKNKPEHIRDSEKEVLNYNRALVELNGLYAAKKLVFDLPLILHIQKTITQDLIANYNSGKIRQEPVFVNNPQKRQTVYWPPDQEEVLALVNDLLNYINKDQIDFTFWLEYFTDGLIDELLRVIKELTRETISPKTELKDYPKKIIYYIKEHGYITDRDYAKLTDRAKPTRNLDFRKLIDLGIIEKLGKGRTTYYKLLANPLDFSVSDNILNSNPKSINN